jgi:DtxR family Mn-dependent transcriptional regulator
MSGSAQYLVAVYVAEQRDGAPVSSGTVADTLGVASGTATEMFHKLADEGLVEYEPYEGATLTEEGRRLAADRHETYVTLSWFFRSVLDLDDYEQEAMEFAGLVSPSVARRLARTLPYEVDTGHETDAGGQAGEREDGRENES